MTSRGDGSASGQSTGMSPMMDGNSTGMTGTSGTSSMSSASLCGRFGNDGDFGEAGDRGHIGVAGIRHCDLPEPEPKCLPKPQPEPYRQWHQWPRYSRYSRYSEISEFELRSIQLASGGDGNGGLLSRSGDSENLVGAGACPILRGSDASRDS